MADAPSVHAGESGEWARRGRGFGWAGLLLVLLGAALFALVPWAEADNRGYAAAPDCPPGTRSGTCRAAVPQIVGSKGTDGGRTVTYHLYLRDVGAPADDERMVRLPDDLPIYDAVRPGDRVTATYWKDEIRAVRFGDAVQEAELSPVHDGRLPGAFAVAALAFGLGALSFWGGLRLRPVRQGAAYPWPHIAGFTAGVLIGSAGFPVVLLGDDVWSGLRFTAWAVLPALVLSVLLCRWTVRRVRRAAARIVPVAPTERRVVTAAVHGDVPYSRAGYGYLLIGDGPVTATTDPAGRVALAPLPETLTVLRVRETLVGDPPFSPPRRGEYYVVVECADGDRTVLVMAGHEDAPRVLGALLEAGGPPSAYAPSD
ncbi:hypothetical protein V2W30_24705 [Streptomyces sp. Q6]|uniref:Uncharacterized protein n=1 Tax=Streptomyces citrinus TaxID=3118173 RepID=A0ACD5AG85_9ACTN